MPKETEKLKAEVERLKKELKKRKKYGLVWEPKDEEVVEMCKKKLPVLKEVKNKQIITDKDKPVNLLIEGDNYHALSVLNYTHAKKVDAIYIDPPYNTGARDWKYNNDYVDINDSFRHSKWLSMMSSRLILAKNLLKSDGVLICAIDENEHANLGVLLEGLFPNKEIHSIVIVHNPRGVQGKNFSYCHDYAYFIFPNVRMPEPEKGHYRSEALNYSYVYTNIEDVEIKEDTARSYITINFSEVKNIHTPISLTSCYAVRHREKTRIKPLFISMFLDEARKYNLKKKIDKKAKKIDMKIIADEAAENIDVLVGKKFIGDKSINLAGFDLQKYFDYFVRERLKAGPTSFYPEDRSVDNTKEAILRFFEKEMNMEFGDGQDIVLSEKNKKHFINVIDKAKESYKEEVMRREKEIKVFDNWNIPEKLTFGEGYLEEDREKCIIQPCYIKYISGLEKAFVEFLENSETVEWWFKNEDRDMTFFAVPYDNGERRPFYVDFIMKLKDGRIGLFDPHGTYLADFKAKSDGLRDYIREENKKGKKLFGGIVANTDQRTYKGRWIYFDKNSKELKNNFSNWKDLEL